MPDAPLRNVVVSGGSRGLGLAIGQRLAQSGFRVIALARGMNDGLQAAQATLGDRLHFHACDLSQTEGFGDLARAVRREFGPIYGVVNNAGLGTAGVLTTMPDMAIEQVIRMNVTSPITLTKYLIRSMLTARAGRVVNISSIVSTTGYNGLAAYGATKAAMIGFTRSLAREVGSLGITVNAVAPGFVDTDMTDGLAPGQREQIMRRSALRRMASAAEVAAAVDFLMGDGAAGITGTVLTVDAGSTA